MADLVTFEWENVRLSIAAVKDRLENPKPVLKEFSRKLTADIKQNIKNGGTGWAPYAESTLKRLQSTGTSQVSARGTIRTDRVKRTLKQLAKVEKQIRAAGWNPTLGAKLDKIRKRVASYRKAEERAHRRSLETAAAKATIADLKHGPLMLKDQRKRDRAEKKVSDSQKDRLGARQAANHPLLHRMPGTIRSKLLDNRTLYVYSAAGKIGQIHNQGSGKTPKRQFLPPPNMQENMEYFKTLMESDLGQAWETGKGRS
ncbi:MAG: hypothetical protein E6Q97_36320 [Desulfurellales bacterium]|nr:MAG: hypothetical protein E6Q97_36320 [Desulfurellales bacterium]